MRLTIVDVFAEHRYAGNQLAVVQDAAELDPETMQSIAREMNFSETTFVIRQDDDGAEVRIFTPAYELPFAGHPTLGTAWVLGRNRPRYVLCLGAGDVEVTFPAGIPTMSPPPVEFAGPIPREEAARMVGLGEDDLDPALAPAQLQCGPVFAVVPVRSMAALARSRVALDDAIRRATFMVCPEPYSDDAHFAARMRFHDGVGVREDPATGSANAAFAAYLRANQRRGEFIVEQGFEIGRPSRIYLSVGDALAVGGRVQAVAEGRLSG